jgi:hypothetical protein
MIKEFKIVIDVEPDDFCESDLEEALKDGLENVGNYDLNSIKTALFLGNPIVFGIQLFEAFEKVGNDGKVMMPEGRSLGGHAMVIVGVNSTHFIVANSWGENWGDKGFCYIFPVWCSALYIGH